MTASPAHPATVQTALLPPLSGRLPARAPQPPTVRRAPVLPLAKSLLRLLLAAVRPRRP